MFFREYQYSMSFVSLITYKTSGNSLSGLLLDFPKEDYRLLSLEAADRILGVQLNESLRSHLHDSEGYAIYLRHNHASRASMRGGHKS